ncbi:putative UDP-glucuronosyl/UDP-glucosyltransferase [Dioscorea sansibarensis]
MQATRKNDSVVLFPSPGMGHLVSMVELAKLFTTQGFTVTILIVQAHYNTGSTTSSFISSVSISNPSVSFHHLPPLPSLPPNPSPHHEAHAFDLLRLSNPSLLHFLVSCSPPPRALILDFFCIFSLDVAKQVSIPCYLFFTSGACVLCSFIHFPTLHSLTSKSFKQLGSEPLVIPGVPPIPANQMPLPMLDREDEAYKGFLYISGRIPDFDGILINTFHALEPRPLDIMASMKIPPIYCIGPLINEDRERNRTAECISWLDTQPKSSVVFLCFGSLGLFSAEQLKEIARGLEISGQRFLWVVRSPPSESPGKYMVAPAEPDLDVLLPQGFLERTNEKGMVVKSWAPQVEVLRHDAVGGFVTHCGWNSVLEAVCAGVGMVGWPLYAEQKINMVFLVEEMKLGVEMRGYEEELVSGEEVGRRVRWLMESDQGKELRQRTLQAKESARATLADGGSSRAALESLVAEWMQ